MLAVNRIPKVIGRIRDLTISIKNKTIDNKKGHPWGIQCRSKFFKLNQVFIVNKALHAVKEIADTILICEVNGKWWGKIETKLSKIMKIIIEIIKKIKTLLKLIFIRE